ncbi:MAG: YceI family protein [Cyclobacteriaceae bacterium]|nr:YceI family protein [Cyclobacteriaceae bacterium]
MKVYTVNPEKSKIKWKSQIGDLHIDGEMSARDGSLVSELGELVEGQVNIDLDSIKIVDSSLDKKNQEKLREHLRSADIFKDQDKLVEYKIQSIVPNGDQITIKGMLNFNNLAFGMDMNAEVQLTDQKFTAHGHIQASKSNLVFLEQLEQMFEGQIKGDQSIKTFEVECDIVAEPGK